ncbi:hypothetical protein AGLY_011400 [Aphis glycines]|uniref:Uncharacterized protein n=1 Tax=Aphis glycines TaxID=307491 RepID=A0A6G0TDX8_APHGL|nr:hypothetical protein AGLY_011400 [Aphis glycines]
MINFGTVLKIVQPINLAANALHPKYYGNHLTSNENINEKEGISPYMGSVCCQFRTISFTTYIHVHDLILTCSVFIYKSWKSFNGLKKSLKNKLYIQDIQRCSKDTTEPTRMNVNLLVLRNNNNNHQAFTSSGRTKPYRRIFFLNDVLKKHGRSINAVIQRNYVSTAANLILILNEVKSYTQLMQIVCLILEITQEYNIFSGYLSSFLKIKNYFNFKYSKSFGIRYMK